MARITKLTPAKRASCSEFPNSGSLPRRRARHSAVVAAPLQPRLPPHPSYHSQGTQTDDPALHKSQGPQNHNSIREKVDSVLELLHKYRWSFAAFIKHYVTASDPSNHDKPERRANRLWRAIFEEPEVEERLMLYGDRQLSRLHQEPLRQQIEEELETLTRPRDQNGVTVPGRLGRFDAQEPVENLDLDTIVADVQSLAPTLWNFLVELVQQRPGVNFRDITPYYDRIFMVCAILANLRAPQASFRFHAALGIHLYNLGVKRRCLGLLHRLGITISYSGLSKIRKELEGVGRDRIKATASKHRNQLTIVYDNFDWNERVRHETTSNTNKHLSATTSKFILNPEFPQDGLHISMLNPTVKLTRNDIFNYPGNQEDCFTQQCQLYWIAEAIAYAMPKVKTLNINENFWPTMPTIDRLVPQKLYHFALGPILENEGTIEGTYGVLKNIFGGDDGDCKFKEGQLGYKEGAFGNGELVLINGDQKTVGLLQATQRERRSEERHYEQLKWFLPIPGLFHWRTNYMDMIHDIYGGPSSCFDSLDYSKIHLGAHLGNKTPFHHKEEVAIKSFNARIAARFLALLPQGLKDKGDEEIINWITGSNLRRVNQNQHARLNFLATIEQIRKEFFSPDERLRTNGSVDEVFQNHVRFVQDMEVYLTLKFAIKHADVGLIKRVIVRCCIIFAGSVKSQYTQLALYLTRLLVTDAAQPVLQRALLASMLVNCRGKEDSWFETDRLNEHHNLVLKLLLQSRRRSSADVTKLFTRVSLTASYCLDLLHALEGAFGEFNSIHHTPADASLDVYRLALELSTNITRRPDGRKSHLNCKDIIDVGTRRLSGGVKEEHPNKSTPLPSNISRAKKPRVPKQPVFYNSLIDGFNAKLQGRHVAVKGLDDLEPTTTITPTTTPIDTLLDRATLDV